ncbi:MAG: hypothetical protein IJ068_01360 [Bacilli bacterium]|nr:hypothetical protein [Bacilli bacterium]
MEDTSFIDLTRGENLSKIKMDEELIPIFKRAMINFQKHFNRMGYTSTRNYKEFFDKYLIGRYPIRNISIEFNKLHKPLDCMGIYYRDKRKIIINRNYEKEPQILLDIFTHEFIHFLVHHYVYDKQIEDNITMIPFFDEALTEMLKTEILPYTFKSYFSLIKMVNFWSIINDKKIDMNLFLKGKIEGIDSNLIEIINDYEYDGLDDYENKFYVNIQRYIINQVNINITNLKEYEKLIEKTAKRPSSDIYFMNKFYKQLERNMFFNLQIYDKSIQKRFSFYLKEYRLIIETLAKRKFNGTLNLNIDDEFYEIDKRGIVYKDEQFYKQIKRIKLPINEKNVNYFEKQIKDIDFNKIALRDEKLKKELINKKERIESILKYLKFISDSVNEEKTTDSSYCFCLNKEKK